MRRTSVEDVRCSVGQCVDVIGDWWTPLIVRESLYNVTRFSDFQRRLNISRNILTQRLDHLVDRGILERRRYQDDPPRDEYILTERGIDLWPILDAMRNWGDKWAAPHGRPVDIIHRTCGHANTTTVTCSHCHEHMTGHDTIARPGPGADRSTPIPQRRPANQPPS